LNRGAEGAVLWDAALQQYAFMALACDNATDAMPGLRGGETLAFAFASDPASIAHFVHREFVMRGGITRDRPNADRRIE
jgi:hypothetical protein